MGCPDSLSGGTPRPPAVPKSTTPVANQGQRPALPNVTTPAPNEDHESSAGGGKGGFGGGFKGKGPRGRD